MAGLNGCKVLVTGGTGFLGSHLCQELTVMGAEVHAFCRPNAQGTPKGVRVWEGSLEDYAGTRELVRTVKPKKVFHLAGFTSAERELGAVLPAFRANLISTVNLLTVLTEVGCRRLVLAGTLEEPHEGDLIPSSPYAASKWAATGYARMFWQLYKTPVVVARIFMVYGPAQRDVKKLIPYAALSLLRGSEPEIRSGTRKVDWIFISDVVSGLIALSEAPGVEGDTVDLGTGHLTSTGEVVEKMARIINPALRPSLGSLPERQGEQVRRADVDRSLRMLGWKPAVHLEDGLRQTIEYYRQHSDLYPP